MAKVRKFSSGGDVPDFSRLTFKEAFQAARGGPNAKTPMNKEFTWNGTKYTTELDEGKKGPAFIPGKIGSMDKGIPLSKDKKAEKVAVAAPAAAKETPYGAAKRALDEATEQAKNPEVLEGLVPGGRLLKGVRGLAAKAALRSKPTSKRVEGSMENTPRMDVEQAAAQGAKRDPRTIEESRWADEGGPNFRRGGKVKKMASGGMTKSASSRGDGIAKRGKTKGRMY